jgi:mRNA-degrading endonuclease RelE of RelBE toxin-antitoxin system
MTRIDVRFSRFFLRNVKQLHKTNPQVIDIVETFADRLREGETPGDQVPGVGYPVYKVRLASGKKGKRGGYCIVYYVHLPTQILLVALYVKAGQENVSPQLLHRIIQEELTDLDE